MGNRRAQTHASQRSQRMSLRAAELSLSNLAQQLFRGANGQWFWGDHPASRWRGRFDACAILLPPCTGVKAHFGRLRVKGHGGVA